MYWNNSIAFLIFSSKIISPFQTKSFLSLMYNYNIFQCKTKKTFSNFFFSNSNFYQINISKSIFSNSLNQIFNLNNNYYHLNQFFSRIEIDSNLYISFCKFISIYHSSNGGSFSLINKNSSLIIKYSTFYNCSTQSTISIRGGGFFADCYNFLLFSSCFLNCYSYFGCAFSIFSSINSELSSFFILKCSLNNLKYTDEGSFFLIGNNWTIKSYNSSLNYIDDDGCFLEARSNEYSTFSYSICNNCSGGSILTLYSYKNLNVNEIIIINSKSLRSILGIIRNSGTNSVSFKKCYFFPISFIEFIGTWSTINPIFTECFFNCLSFSNAIFISNLNLFKVQTLPISTYKIFIECYMIPFETNLFFSKFGNFLSFFNVIFLF